VADLAGVLDVGTGAELLGELVNDVDAHNGRLNRAEFAFGAEPARLVLGHLQAHNRVSGGDLFLNDLLHLSQFKIGQRSVVGEVEAEPPANLCADPLRERSRCSRRACSNPGCQSNSSMPWLRNSSIVCSGGSP
jgi:hypothetical protein